MDATQGLLVSIGHFKGRTTVMEVITDTNTPDGEVPEPVNVRRRKGRALLPTQEDTPRSNQPSYGRKKAKETTEAPTAVAAPPVAVAEPAAPMRRRG